MWDDIFNPWLSTMHGVVTACARCGNWQFFVWRIDRKWRAEFVAYKNPQSVNVGGWHLTKSAAQNACHAFFAEGRCHD